MWDTLLQLAGVSQAKLAGLPESGMGYVLASALLPDDRSESLVIVGGNDYVIPLEPHPRFFSLADLLAGQPFPSIVPRVVTVALTAPAAHNVATLPAGYLPVAGAIALLGTIMVSSKTRFYRYTGTVGDRRFSGTHLAVDTYLTTEADQTYANTGFAAVGRYALPIPVPASYVHVYDLPVGTSLLVGTVLPNYGQAGGGVEVKTLASAGIGPTATLVSSGPIDDF
ncbi:hypothetical protein [Longimicrobium sp.]|jgi:hypothetical protein|uniref:hypothetical protein n=1 Tax=Longimicrobium sp. TaxID=2029185 RepID=UPI002EDA790E